MFVSSNLEIRGTAPDPARDEDPGSGHNDEDPDPDT